MTDRVMTKNDVLEMAKKLGMSDKSAIKYVNLAQSTFEWRDKKCIEKEIKAILILLSAKGMRHD